MGNIIYTNWKHCRVFFKGYLNNKSFILWKCSPWCTIEDFFYFMERSCSILEIITCYLFMKLAQLMNMVIGNIFRNNFAWFEGLEPKCRPFFNFLSYLNLSRRIMINLWFFILLKLCTKMIQNNHHHLLKTNISHYISINEIIKGPCS